MADISCGHGGVPHQAADCMLWVGPYRLPVVYV